MRSGSSLSPLQADHLLSTMSTGTKDRSSIERRYAYEIIRSSSIATLNRQLAADACCVGLCITAPLPCDM